MWVTTEYAQALGYRVRPYAEAVQSAQPQVIAAAPSTVTAPRPTMPPTHAPGAQAPQAPPGQSWPPGAQAPQAPPGQSWPPGAQAPQAPPGQSWPPGAQAPQAPPGQSWPPGAQAPQAPPGQSWPPGAQAPQAPPGQSWPPGAQAPQAPPGQSWPPAQPSSGRPPTPGSGRKRGLIAAGTAAGLVVIFFIVAAVAGIAPFSKSHPQPNPQSHDDRYPAEPIPSQRRRPRRRCPWPPVSPPSPSWCRVISPTRRHNARPLRSPAGAAPGWSRPYPAMTPTCRMGT